VQRRNKERRLGQKGAERDGARRNARRNANYDGRGAEEKSRDDHHNDGSGG